CWNVDASVGFSSYIKLVLLQLWKLGKELLNSDMVATGSLVIIGGIVLTSFNVGIPYPGWRLEEKDIGKLIPTVGILVKNPWIYSINVERSKLSKIAKEGRASWTTF